jgi:hypothetical protein
VVEMNVRGCGWIALSFVLACASHEGAESKISPRPQPAPAAGVPADAKITLERTMCYGTYIVTLHADGRVQWQGEDFVEVVGPADGRIEPEQFAELWQRLSAQPWDRLPDGARHVSCPRMATDNPSVNVTISGGGRAEIVRDYHGCDGNPDLDALRTIEVAIDEVTDTDRWVGSGQPR